MGGTRDTAGGEQALREGLVWMERDGQNPAGEEQSSLNLCSVCQNLAALHPGGQGLPPPPHCWLEVAKYIEDIEGHSRPGGDGLQHQGSVHFGARAGHILVEVSQSHRELWALPP